MGNSYHDNRNSWLIITAIIAVVAIGVGLFFYHNFFRQTNAKLIEVVPDDAACVFQINDNETFVKSSATLLPFLNEIFFLNALSGFEFFIDQFPSHNNEILISSHNNGEKFVLLFSTKIEKQDFKNLLKTLRIDSRNFTPFEELQIYSFGTHFSNYKFVFYNNVFIASEDIELLKRSIVQFRHPKNLLSNKEFNSIYKMVEKNTKQNWMMIQYSEFFPYFKDFVNTLYQDSFSKLVDLAEWSAFQMNISDMELRLSGYTISDSPFFSKFSGSVSSLPFPEKLLPFNTPYYAEIKDSDPQNIANQTNNIPKDEIAVYKRLNPITSYYFTLPKDSLMYHYWAVNVDTTKTKFADLFPVNTNVDSLIQNTTSTIFEVNLGSVSTLLSSLHASVSLKYCMKMQNFYVFSDTSVALQYYYRNVTSGNCLEKNPFYRYSSENMHDGNLFAFCFYNDNENIKPYLSSKVKKNNLAKSFKIFMYSIDSPDKSTKLIPTNIYLKF